MLTYAFPLLSLILFPFVRDADRSCVPSPSPLLPDALIHTSPYHSLSFPPLVPSTDHLSFLSLAHFQSRLYPQSDLYYYEVFSLISPPPSLIFLLYRAWVRVSPSNTSLYSRNKIRKKR